PLRVGHGKETSLAEGAHASALGRRLLSQWGRASVRWKHGSKHHTLGRGRRKGVAPYFHTVQTWPALPGLVAERQHTGIRGCTRQSRWQTNRYRLSLESSDRREIARMGRGPRG